MEEQKEKSLKSYKTISIILFAGFVFSLILLFVSFFLSETLFALLSIYMAFIAIPLYFLWICIFLLFALIKQNKQDVWLNLIGLLVIIFTMMLNNSCGFCSKNKKYYSKLDLIEMGLKYRIDNICDFEKNIAKREECSLSLDRIKKEASHCFGVFSTQDSCKSTISFYDFETDSILRKEVLVYKMKNKGRGSIFWGNNKFSFESSIGSYPNEHIMRQYYESKGHILVNVEWQNAIGGFTHCGKILLNREIIFD
jgi:hypothetical protein